MNWKKLLSFLRIEGNDASLTTDLPRTELPWFGRLTEQSASFEGEERRRSTT